MIRRHPDARTGPPTTFDVLVVGGGIYGLTIAYDAAQRGLSVALIERNDFGSGSSFNHLRTIHGGLRYLQSLDLSRARESIRERRTLAQIAPHAVRPLPFVAPAVALLDEGPPGHAQRALLLDRLVSFDRHRGVPARTSCRPVASCPGQTPSTAFPGCAEQRTDRRGDRGGTTSRRGRPPDVFVGAGCVSAWRNPRELRRGDQR